MNKSKIRNDLFVKSDLLNDLSKSDKKMTHRTKNRFSALPRKELYLYFSVCLLLCLKVNRFFIVLFEIFWVLFADNFDLPMLILTSIQMHLNLWLFMGFTLSTGSPSKFKLHQRLILSMDNVEMKSDHRLQKRSR